MKLKFFISFSFFLFAFTAVAQQSEKLLIIGPEVDLPISRKVAGLPAFGGNISYAVPGKKTTAAIFGFSLLKQQYTEFRFLSGGVPTYTKRYNTLYKITGGVLTKLGGNWYNTVNGGMYIQQYKGGGDVKLLIAAGPMVFLPVGKNKIRLGLNASYSTGLFATLSAAYGFKR